MDTGDPGQKNGQTAAALAKRILQLQGQIAQGSKQLKPLRDELKDANEELIERMNKSDHRRWFNTQVLIQKRKSTTKGAVSLADIRRVFKESTGADDVSVEHFMRLLDETRKRKTRFKLSVTPTMSGGLALGKPN